MPRSRPLLVVPAVAALVALTACTNQATPSPSPSTEAPDASTPSATATPTASASTGTPLSSDELSTLLESVDFAPTTFETQDEMFSSIYPGVSASDAACLLPFGVGWEADPELAAAQTAFGPSIDRSMTAVLASSASVDDAEDIADRLESAVEDCLESGATFSVQGVPIDFTADDFDLELNGDDDSEAWRATGTVAGTSLTLVGSVARKGTTVIAIVGWDPDTNEEYVPQATQLILDRL